MPDRFQVGGHSHRIEYDRPMKQRSALLLVLAPIALARAAAAAPPALSGPATFVIADCNNASLALRFLADPAPLAVRTKDIMSQDQTKPRLPGRSLGTSPSGQIKASTNTRRSAHLKTGVPHREDTTCRSS